MSMSKFAIRSLRRTPGVTVAAIATLSMGIAVTTAMFAVTHAVLLRGLPYADPDRVVSVAEFDMRRDSASGNVSWPDFLDYQSATRTLASLAGYNGGSRTLTGPDVN